MFLDKQFLQVFSLTPRPTCKIKRESSPLGKGIRLTSHQASWPASCGVIKDIAEVVAREAETVVRLVWSSQGIASKQVIPKVNFMWRTKPIKSVYLIAWKSTTSSHPLKWRKAPFHCFFTKCPVQCQALLNLAFLGPEEPQECPAALAPPLTQLSPGSKPGPLRWAVWAHPSWFSVFCFPLLLHDQLSHQWKAYSYRQTHLEIFWVSRNRENGEPVCVE